MNVNVGKPRGRAEGTTGDGAFRPGVRDAPGRQGIRSSPPVEKHSFGLGGGSLSSAQAGHSRGRGLQRQEPGHVGADVQLGVGRWSESYRVVPCRRDPVRLDPVRSGGECLVRAVAVAGGYAVGSCGSSSEGTS